MKCVQIGNLLVMSKLTEKIHIVFTMKGNQVTVNSTFDILDSLLKSLLDPTCCIPGLLLVSMVVKDLRFSFLVLEIFQFFLSFLKNMMKVCKFQIPVDICAPNFIGLILLVFIEYVLLLIAN
jgi:hypothetical protein